MYAEPCKTMGVFDPELNDEELGPKKNFGLRRLLDRDTSQEQVEYTWKHNRFETFCELFPEHEWLKERLTQVLNEIGP